MDLGVILGDVGKWVIDCMLNDAKERGDKDAKKLLSCASDIIESYMENGLDVLSQEKKYNFMNKFGPKKFPDQ